jgi:Domain of unknown function (DUF4340)
MVRRPTWILLLVFVLLVGFAWFFQRYQTNKANNVATATPTTSPVNLYNLANTPVDKINITDKAGDKIDFYHDSGSTNWAIAGVPVDQANSFQIESISTQLSSLQVQETLAQSPPLDSIGLVTPAYTITMTTTDGTQLITYVGSQTAVGSGYYVRVDSGQVVIVDKVVMDDILNLLKNPPLLPTATPEVTPTETAPPTESGGQGTPTP